MYRMSRNYPPLLNPMHRTTFAAYRPVNSDLQSTQIKYALRHFSSKKNSKLKCKFWKDACFLWLPPSCNLTLLLHSAYRPNNKFNEICKELCYARVNQYPVPVPRDNLSDISKLSLVLPLPSHRFLTRIADPGWDYPDADHSQLPDPT